jgi:branched-chain amino acid transport system ATP-binding protein
VNQEADRSQTQQAHRFIDRCEYFGKLLNRVFMLSIENLMVFYENALAINNVSLTVSENSITGIMGSNGAGKSTLMYTISGIILDRKIKEERRGGERIGVFGRIGYNQQDLTQFRASQRVRRGIVLCPERRRVFPESTVLENLRIGSYLRARREEHDTLEEIWELFPELRLLRSRRAGFLSGGEQQMLAIGRALMAGPELLLLDEPLLGLAPAIQVKVVDAIRNISRSGVTILVTEQYARPILPIIEEGFVLESGSITLRGTGRELMANPNVRAAYFGV